MFDPANLQKIAILKMPFGKYKGRTLIELPGPYLVWFARQGFTQNQIGELLQLTYQIKVNGLEELIYPLQGSGEGPRGINNINQRSKGNSHKLLSYQSPL